MIQYISRITNQLLNAQIPHGCLAGGHQGRYGDDYASTAVWLYSCPAHPVPLQAHVMPATPP